jgi:hypothetical protein
MALNLEREKPNQMPFYILWEVRRNPNSVLRGRKLFKWVLDKFLNIV